MVEPSPLPPCSQKRIELVMAMTMSVSFELVLGALSVIVPAFPYLRNDLS